MLPSFCQHSNNTVGLPGFLCPNPILRSFDCDPDQASFSIFSDGLWLIIFPAASV
ncbi:MAG: hypothetical protein ACOX52_14385 [Verrucomicrobiota bacterium]